MLMRFGQLLSHTYRITSLHMRMRQTAYCISGLLSEMQLVDIKVFVLCHFDEVDYKLTVVDIMNLGLFTSAGPVLITFVL